VSVTDLGTRASRELGSGFAELANRIEVRRGA
jgi:hypothetical protein